MNRYRLQIEELEPRNLPSGATVERIGPFVQEFQITVQLCNDGSPVPAQVNVEAVVSGMVVTTPNGGSHQHSQINTSRTIIEVEGQEFLIQRHGTFVMNAGPSGTSNSTNVSHLLVIPPGSEEGCSDEATRSKSLQHQTINANGVITADIGDDEVPT